MGFGLGACLDDEGAVTGRRFRSAIVDDFDVLVGKEEAQKGNHQNIGEKPGTE